MEKSEFRDRVTDAVDAIRNEINFILGNLCRFEDEANMDAEVLDHGEIRGLQFAVVEAIKALMNLADALD